VAASILILVVMMMPRAPKAKHKLQHQDLANRTWKNICDIRARGLLTAILKSKGSAVIGSISNHQRLFT